MGPDFFLMAKEHSATPLRKPFPGRGIGGEFVDEVKLLKGSGLGASGIHLKLRQKYGQHAATKDEAKCLRLPTKEKIQSYINTNIHSVDELLSNVDLLAHVNPMLVRSWVDIQTRDPNEVLVLEVFCRTVDMLVLDEVGNSTKETTKETTLGFVTANRSMLEWHRELLILISLDVQPRPFTLMISCGRHIPPVQRNLNSRRRPRRPRHARHHVQEAQGHTQDTHNFLPPPFTSALHVMPDRVLRSLSHPGQMLLE